MLGKCDVDKVAYPKYVNRIKRFIGDLDPRKRYADIGPENPKMNLLKKLYGIDVVQVDNGDFNKYYLTGVYDVVFCFEIIEHLQNPLFFMSQVKNILAKGGVIYLSTPNTPRWMWSPFHFFEMSPEHLEKWIINPLGLKIIRYKNIKAPYNLHNFGIRPLLRYFLSSTNIYKITI